MVDQEYCHYGSACRLLAIGHRMIDNLAPVMPFHILRTFASVADLGLIVAAVCR
jgi:hypothetical protein